MFSSFYTRTNILQDRIKQGIRDFRADAEYVIVSQQNLQFFVSLVTRLVGIEP